MRRVFAALALAAIVALGAAAVTRGHDGLASSDPEPGERVDGELRRVVVTFAIDVADPNVRLLDPDEQEVAATLEQTGPETVVLEFQPLTRKGQYIVQFAADGSDGHPVTGAFAFTFRSGGVTADVLLPVLVTTGAGAIVASLVLTWWYRRTWRQRDRADANRSGTLTAE